MILAIRRLIHSRKCVFGAVVLLFLYMLVLNCLTPYVADDYVYRISFYDGQQIGSVSDVVKSMYAHCSAMNGRVVSHGLEQLFMLVPKMAFNLCNAAVYGALMYMLYRVSNFGKQASPLLLLAICAAFWYFMPVFGQVALWQVGALNYLWGLAVGLAFLLPYIVCYVKKTEPLPKLWMKILFSLAALPMGMYTEIMSFIAILLGVLLLMISAATGRVKWKSYLWIPLAIACVGFLIMVTMPAEVNAKQGDLTLEQLLRNFDTATDMLRSYLLWPVIAWGCFFALAAYGRAQTERLVLSGLFAFGAVAANYMLTVASYYPERCLYASCMLLILACTVLVPELGKGGMGAFRACAGAALTVVFLFSLVSGSYEIWRTYTSFTAREIVIAQAIEDGEQDLILQCVHANNKYSAFWGTLDLNTETSDTWPNNQMAAYYGVSSILGY